MQRLLFWQAVVVIPAMVTIAVVGTVLSARHMRRLEQAIRRLGQGEWSAPVEEVSGPRDLEELGRQLDWLRLRLLDLDGQKVKFLRHVSHELKTPLSALREGAELLGDEAVGKLNAAQDAGRYREDPLSEWRRAAATGRRDIDDEYAVPFEEAEVTLTNLATMVRACLRSDKNRDCPRG